MQGLHTNGFCLVQGRLNCGNNNAKNHEGKVDFAVYVKTSFRNNHDGNEEYVIDVFILKLKITILFICIPNCHAQFMGISPF